MLLDRRRITVDADSLDSEIRDRSVLVVDVRKRDEYLRDHIPGAVNLPLASLLKDDSPGRVAELVGHIGIGDETAVAVYDDTFGALASRMAWTLEYLGHGSVSLLDTTYGGWKALGLGSESSTPEIRPGTHSINLNPSILATSDYLEQAKGRDGVTLLDNRERLNYLEQHIPGAVNIPYRTLASDGKILRSPSEMGRLLENRGISKGGEIITYCGSVGTLSGLAYYALKSAQVHNVKLYVRSFKEWKKLESPPRSKSTQTTGICRQSSHGITPLWCTAAGADARYTTSFLSCLVTVPSRLSRSSSILFLLLCRYSSPRSVSLTFHSLISRCISKNCSIICGPQRFASINASKLSRVFPKLSSSMLALAPLYCKAQLLESPYRSGQLLSSQPEQALPLRTGLSCDVRRQVIHRYPVKSFAPFIHCYEALLLQLSERVHGVGLA